MATTTPARRSRAARASEQAKKDQPNLKAVAESSKTPKPQPKPGNHRRGRAGDVLLTEREAAGRNDGCVRAQVFARARKGCSGVRAANRRSRRIREVAVELFTASYQAWRSGMGSPVVASLLTPRWLPEAAEWPRCPEIMPRWRYFNAEAAEFEREYLAQLTRYDPE